MTEHEIIILKILKNEPNGRECTPSHEIIKSLLLRGYIELSDAVCGFERLKDSWAKITNKGDNALSVAD